MLFKKMNVSFMLLPVMVEDSQKTVFGFRPRRPLYVEHANGPLRLGTPLETGGPRSFEGRKKKAARFWPELKTPRETWHIS